MINKILDFITVIFFIPTEMQYVFNEAAGIDNKVRKAEILKKVEIKDGNYYLLSEDRIFLGTAFNKTWFFNEDEAKKVLEEYKNEIST
jgi:hypothetical protein